ncbi:DEAD/DEAH box helicase [Bradyrhizobium australafricanum]|uniref:DEAD/DEAH box helicase n=1 Tax=Bradyrhizobium australafricanum TaxID=2821406 RepID=UPI001CE2CAE9|nr:DEAD/DEAH box helicase [Bradyrhizobium australafricanum]MCA6098166.1 DEAD/DEAH box helicase [Bradyrhizobium australafricanum]
MTWPVDTADLGERLDLRNDRVSDSDALRQQRTIAEILRRLGHQPGIVLADEVGMGKTFVALGVAMIAALADRGKRPVVIMVPSSLHGKWPRDFAVFKERVIERPGDASLRAEPVASALDFFRLMDSEAKSRPHIIFLKHGAFHVQNIDQWVRLALIKRAISGMHLGEKRSALPRFAAGLLRTKSSYNDPELFAKLLRVPNREWRNVINDHYRDRQLTEAPVPEAIQKVLDSSDIDVAGLRECLRDLPARESVSIDERLERARRAINDALRAMWPSTLAKASFRSPLLILDEAHHLKNPATRLASLFVTDDAREDAGTITGALDGSFERMMFLTATPFQLGHHELLNVIGRFQGVAWKTLSQSTKEEFEAELASLGTTLDRAQHRAAELDKRWSSLRPEDVAGPNGGELSVEDWWQDTMSNPAARPERIQIVMRAFQQAQDAMKEAEAPLRKWVIRHLRDSLLPGTTVPRRSRQVGRAISLSADGSGGLPVGDDALLPFLLAARAQAVVVREGMRAGRATFAEGLASSYEAFLETRRGAPLGEDEEEAAKSVASDKLVNLYVEKLAAALPNEAAYAQHPKIAPLVSRVLDLWRHREKVVVFCHYRETGRAIVRHLSAALEEQLWNDAAQRFELGYADVRKAVIDFGARFDTDGGMRQPLDDELIGRLAPYAELSDGEREKVHDVVRRFVRTPLFVARYFDIRARSGKETLQAAFDTRDLSGVALGEKIDGFLKFIARRCSPRERHDYLDALTRMQPGIRGETQRDTDDDLSQMKGAIVMPNIRLANGLVKQETRQRLMLAFNTPFFPEILVASSVLAEGVDLHLSCRHVIHHDLSWNPSTLEQRTGRVDRIGAIAETVAKPIEVFLPYVGGTQDEKQFRVVMDRERWFQVLMGADYRTDESFTEKAAERIPLPAAAAKALAFDLSVKSASDVQE